VTSFAWVIDDIEDGVVNRAHCSCGGLGWERPDYDLTGETLSGVARWHICRPGIGVRESGQSR
jgi:hypothetical protein